MFQGINFLDIPAGHYFTDSVYILQKVVTPAGKRKAIVSAQRPDSRERPVHEAGYSMPNYNQRRFTYIGTKRDADRFLKELHVASEGRIK
jgi:hypothetical protein